MVFVLLKVVTVPSSMGTRGLGIDLDTNLSGDVLGDSISGLIGAHCSAGANITAEMGLRCGFFGSFVMKAKLKFVRGGCRCGGASGVAKARALCGGGFVSVPLGMNLCLFGGPRGRGNV